MTATTTPKKPAAKKPAAPKKPKAAAAHAHAPAHKEKEHVKLEVKDAASQSEASLAPKGREVKAAVEPEVAVTTEEVAAPKSVPHGKHYYAVGRRKTAVTQVLVSAGNGTIMINKLPFEGYFQTIDLRQIVLNPMIAIGVDKILSIKAKVHGGGIHSQAESMRHAISRALLQYNPESRKVLKKLGFLKRDPRVKERKKPGLKRARRAPQFSKR